MQNFLATNQRRELPQICNVDYGEHIGEYIRQKLDETGRKHNWVAGKLGVQRQNFTKSYLEKPELTREQIDHLKEILGKDFFDDYYKKNPGKGYPEVEESFEPNSGTPPSIYGRTLGSGHMIHLEIDPDNFNPKRTEALSESLLKALQDYKRKIEEDEL